MPSRAALLGLQRTNNTDSDIAPPSVSSSILYNKKIEVLSLWPSIKEVVSVRAGLEPRSLEPTAYCSTLLLYNPQITSENLQVNPATPTCWSEAGKSQRVYIM